MMHIELLIFYFFTHYNFPMFSVALSKTSSSSSGHFFVSWGSRYPRQPFLCLKNRCAYLGVPPRMEKKYLEFIISVKVQRQSFSAESSPILDMTKITKLSLSVGIQLRKMELSLQTVTLQVRLNFSRAAFNINPASQGVNHQNYFLCGQRFLDILVKVCNENGMSLLSQNKGAMVCILAFSFLNSRLARAIWVTLSMHPQPESDLQQVVGKILRILLRQVRRINSYSSSIFLEVKNVRKDANIPQLLLTSQYLQLLSI